MMRSSKKQPENNLYLSIPPQEQVKRLPMLGKPYSSQNINIKCFNQFRSASKNHHRLKTQLLKKKAHGNYAQFFSPDQKFRSPEGQGKAWKGIESKSTEKSQTEAQLVKQIAKNAQYRNGHEENHKKAREQLEQIRNVKKQKTIKPPEVKQFLNGKRADQIKENTAQHENAAIILRNLKIEIESIRSDYNCEQRNNIEDVDKKSEESSDSEQARSLNLQLQSKIKPKLSFSLLPEHFGQQKLSQLSTLEKIENHLDVIERLSLFVDETRHFYDIEEEWLEVNFLIYKKYYLERGKVLNFINKYPMKNPFIVQNATIASKQIIQFMKTQEGANFKEELELQNKIIKQKLHCYYQAFDKNIVGQKINLHESDNFSKWIIDDLWAESILTQHNTDHSQQNTNVRLCKILQVIFLVSELNGKTLMNFQEATYAIKRKNCQQYIDQARAVFQRQLLYKQY